MARQFPYIVDYSFHLEDWRYCLCPECGIVERYGPRINEGHVGIRFDDWRGGGWRITLNGEDVSKSCEEALAGKNGWALLYRDAPRICPESTPLSQHSCKNVYWGECTVSLRQEIPS